MKITWLGTAGFFIETGKGALLIDPYLTRNPDSIPYQEKTKDDFLSASHIFISHGHFDHLADVYSIAERSGAIVHCNSDAAQTLLREGLDPNQIDVIVSDKKTIDCRTFCATALYGRHIMFDFKLIVKTLLRINLHSLKYIPFLMRYKCGQVINWEFEIEGRVIRHMGSGGLNAAELASQGSREVDILMIPLQGHTHICNIASGYAKAVKPSIIIPHHHDNFFPPLSEYIDISSFIGKVKLDLPDTAVYELKINEPFSV